MFFLMLYTGLLIIEVKGKFNFTSLFSSVGSFKYFVTCQTKVDLRLKILGS